MVPTLVVLVQVKFKFQIFKCKKDILKERKCGKREIIVVLTRPFICTLKIIIIMNLTIMILPDSFTNKIQVSESQNFLNTLCILCVSIITMYLFIKIIVNLDCENAPHNIITRELEKR